MSTLNLNPEELEFFTRAAGPAREWYDRHVANTLQNPRLGSRPRSWVENAYTPTPTPFITFAFDWIHGRIVQDCQLLEMPWVNRSFNTNTGLCMFEFYDGSYFEIRDLQIPNDPRHGVYIDGPLEGTPVDYRVADWIVRSLRDNNLNRFTHPVSNIRPNRFTTPPFEYDGRPAFSEVTYVATMYLLPGDPSMSGRHNNRPFLILRQQT